MCWSGEASTVLATVSLGGTAYVAMRGEKKELWLCLGYFSLMEALQAYTYTVIDECNSPANQVATLLGYLHIAFQPFFLNAMSLHFVPERVRNRLYLPVFTVCFACMIVFLVRVYPFEWANQCLPNWMICGAQICSYSGDWHIAWQLPAKALSLFGVWYDSSGFVGYFLPAFLMPMFYGSWRFTIYHLLVGPVAAFLTTSDSNEWPAIWCLFSIGLLLIVVKTPIRKIMYVETFYSRPYPSWD
jgi:hypothetical protein